MVNMLAKSKLKKPVVRGVLMLEFFLAALVIIGTGFYLVLSLGVLFSDYSDPKIYFSDLVSIFLSAIIGIEVGRVLITHNLIAMFDVLGLILVRKALDPKTSVLEVLILVFAFAVLILARKITDAKKTGEKMFSKALDELASSGDKHS